MTLSTHRHLLRRLLLLVLAAAVLPACRATQGNESTPVQHLVPEVLAVYPHDPRAFTQGLLFHDGRLYESTGLYGRSELREIDPASGSVLRCARLEDRFFGEGLALVGERLIQLTWGERTALVYDRPTFAPLGRFHYEGEGWGLCFDGSHLFRSDGGSTLYLHDPDTFDIVGTLPVIRQGRPQAMLNELACVGDHIYANVFLTDEIVRIDKHSGRVTALIEAGQLLSAEQRATLPSEAVLNGIAHDPHEDVFYLTGKLWPKLFKVRLR